MRRLSVSAALPLFLLLATAALTAGSCALSPALGGYKASELLLAPKHVPLQLRLSVPTGQSTQLSKAPGESVQHLLLKALCWALYLPQYPSAICEPSADCRIDVGSPYRPDAVALGSTAQPVWWAECGSVSAQKLGTLVAQLPDTHFTVAKWARSDVSGYASSLRAALPSQGRAPFEVLSFPEDTERFISDDGRVSVQWSDLLDRVSLYPER